MAGKTTYRYFVYDVLQSFKSSYPDADIKDNHILYWTRTIENLIRKRHLDRTETGAYLTIFDGISVLIDSRQRKYFELPAPIYDLVMEKGIEFISYDRPNGIAFTQTFFQVTSPAEAHRLYYTAQERPASDNPYFYRVNKNVYLLGVELLNLKFVQAGLYAALDPKSSMVDLDDEIGLNEEQIHSLRIELLNMGRYVMMVPSDRLETGADDRAGAERTRLRTTLTNQEEQQQQAQPQPEE